MPSRLAALALLLSTAAPAASSGDRAAALSSRLAGELRSARALPDLFRLDELHDEVADLPALGRLFDKIAGDRRARAEVRAAALELRAQLAAAEGQLPRARSIIERAAPVRAWSVIGPFDNDGRTGLRAVYGPETDGYDPAAKYPGKDHVVSWRALPQQLFPLGYVDLSSAVWPAQDSTGYAATVLRSPRARIRRSTPRAGTRRLSRSSCGPETTPCSSRWRTGPASPASRCASATDGTSLCRRWPARRAHLAARAPWLPSGKPP